MPLGTVPILTRARSSYIIAVPLSLLAATMLSGDRSALLSTHRVQSCGVPYAGFRPASETFFVGTAVDDTVQAASGDVFGQVVNISRLGGRTLGTDLTDGAADVVLIPWGFDEQCKPIRWSGSWLWSTPGSTGFYRGLVRPQTEWVDNRPTIDVYGAAWEGFPASPWDHPMATGMPKLTADELYDLYARLPTRDEVIDRPYAAVSDLVDWKREAGAMAERYPAATILESAFEVAEVVRVRQSPIPFAGTYRITIESDDEILGSFWLRTGESGAAPWAPSRVAGPRETGASPAPSGAVAVPAALASRIEALGNATSACARETALSGSEALSDMDDVQGWRALLPLSFVASCFSDQAVLRNLVERPESDSEAERDRFPGAFVREDDGRMTFRQPATLSGGTIVEMRGERIDVRTLPPVDPLEGWADERPGSQQAAASDTGQQN